MNGKENFSLERSRWIINTLSTLEKVKYSSFNLKEQVKLVVQPWIIWQMSLFNKYSLLLFKYFLMLLNLMNTLIKKHLAKMMVHLSFRFLSEFFLSMKYSQHSILKYLDLLNHLIRHFLLQFKIIILKKISLSYLYHKYMAAFKEKFSFKIQRSQSNLLLLLFRFKEFNINNWQMQKDFSL